MEKRRKWASRFINRNVTEENYKKILQYYAFLKFWEYPGDTMFKRMVLLRASPFLHVNILTNLSQLLDGRAVPVSWPPRPPDFMLFHYFSQRYLNDVVYEKVLNAIQSPTLKSYSQLKVLTKILWMSSSRTWKITSPFVLGNEIRGWSFQASSKLENPTFVVTDRNYWALKPLKLLEL